MKKGKEIKICLISSSGGHFEQLSMLKKLGEKYSTYIVTEKTDYDTQSDYTLIKPGGGKMIGYMKFFLNCFLSLKHLFIEKPDVIISTGTRAAIPTVFWGHLFGKKNIYIETFARVHDGTKAAKIVYKHRWYDMFIYQWEPLKELYPKGVYGGGIY